MIPALKLTVWLIDRTLDVLELIGRLRGRRTFPTTSGKPTMAAIHYHRTRPHVNDVSRDATTAGGEGAG